MATVTSSITGRCWRSHSITASIRGRAGRTAPTPHARASGPYRAKTKGKVERPFSYIRQDFFLARSFRNLDDLNAQLDDWLATVANVRVHGTAQGIASRAFARRRPARHAP